MQIPQIAQRARFAEEIFEQVQELLTEKRKLVSGGTIVDATIINAPYSTEDREKKRDSKLHSVKKNAKWHFVMRAHVGVDPVQGFVHTVV